jgi:hypothetical protein
MNANSGIGRQRELAIGALLSSQTIEEAAKKINRHERTLRRWLEQPSFRDAYLEARRRLLQVGVGKLTTKVSLAVDVLAEVAAAKGRAHQVARVQAAAAIIKLSLDAQTIDDVLTRIERLERQRCDDEWRFDDEYHETPKLN